MNEKTVGGQFSIAIAIEYHAAKAMDIKEELNSITVLLEDITDDSGFWFGKGASAVESIHADDVAGSLGPKHVEVAVKINASADVVDHVAGGAVLPP